MKPFALALVCLAALISIGASSCSSMPVYDECITTIDVDSLTEKAIKCVEDKTCILAAINESIVADCIKYERHGAEIDGMYLYTAEHRANIIRWAKESCGRSGR